jgi:hypothetical protein
VAAPYPARLLATRYAVLERLGGGTPICNGRISFGGRQYAKIVGFQLLNADFRAYLGLAPAGHRIAGVPALVLPAVAPPLHNVHVIAPPAALHVQTFSTVHVH